MTRAPYLCSGRRGPIFRTLVLCAAMAAATAAHAAETQPWLDTSASFETRAAALVGQIGRASCRERV